MMFTYSDIQKAVNGSILQEGNPGKVRRISTDSRKAKRGDLFFAIKGDRFDGHQFIPQVIQSGVQVVIVEKKITCPCDVTVIQVKSSVRAMGLLARFYRDQFSIPVIAITGSAGKTSTKEILAKVLSSQYKVLKNEKSFNNQIGVPLTLFQLRASHQVAVLELGTNQLGDIEELTKICRPTISIFTNIGDSHLLGLTNRQGVFKEKKQLIRFMKKDGVVILNQDDSLLRTVRSTKKVLSYGIHNKASYQAQEVRAIRGRTFFKLGKEEICFRGVGEHQLYNRLAAISCSRLLGISYNNIKNSIKRVKELAGRFEVVSCSGIDIINDTYNANVVSFKAAVDAVLSMKVRGRRFVVCGDMLELGKFSLKIHREVGELLAKSSVDVVMSFGKESAAISKAFSQMAKAGVGKHFQSRAGLHQAVKRFLKPGDCVLIKGSRGMKMEKTVEFLLK